VHGARQPGDRRGSGLRHHSRTRRSHPHVRRRPPRLPWCEPGPGRAGGGARLPGAACARPGAGRHSGHRRLWPGEASRPLAVAG
jgi:hypothetical protein